MPLLDLLLPLSIFWIGIHALNALLKNFQNDTLLPSNVNSTSHRPRTLVRKWNLSNTTLSLRFLHLVIHTSACNAPYDAFADKLRNRRHSRMKRWITTFYDLGVVLGWIGMLVAVCGLAWTAGRLCWQNFEHYLTTPEHHVSAGIHRRSLNGIEEQQNSHLLNVTPIIPGVTVPFSHLPMIIIAVFTCQLFHEFGHALGGALESAPLVSVGASFTVLFPSAFVQFSQRYVETLPPQRKARIISAGPWHNLVLWLALFAVGRVGVWVERSMSVGRLLYKDVGDVGCVVVGVDGDSPLNGYLPLGSVITQLDDTELGGKDDIWTIYLTGLSRAKEQANGWCVSRQSFKDASNSCCLPTASSTPLVSCFTSRQAQVRGCLDPVEVLTSSTPRTRCLQDKECNTNLEMCVWPDKTASLMRIRFRESADDDKTVLWNGPRKEVWEQVIVSKYIPRFWFVPLGAATVIATFFEYLMLATLSLYLFNLLPLPMLDGSQLLDTGLNMLSDTPDRDLESAEDGRRTGRWSKRCGEFITASITVREKEKN
ncbi:membrane-bound transcription factor site-2 protease-like [Moniliophthora roreri MCA 2997]|uniref:Endopeptidase S2P n=1 Tax=Moniliophthora roreri (strain MCA 2997) TaxID=1381753 RepID=V2WPE4_MONRO|nr:membrane-bound transcription factor site-2 protease-like [Moniliophthora roreri MCA 2997]